MKRRVYEPSSTNRARQRMAIALSLIVLLAGTLALLFLRGETRGAGHDERIIAVALLAAAYLGLRVRLAVTRRRPASPESSVRPPRRRPRFPAAKSD